jgi:ketosteroid isomerase-like protein
MEAAQRNRESVLAIYRSMRERDLPAFTALVHPEIEVSQPEWLPYGGRHHGLDGLLAMFGQMLRLVDVRALALDSVVAQADDVWAQFTVHAVADGSELQVAEHWRFDDGLARQLTVWIRDPRALMPR